VSLERDVGLLRSLPIFAAFTDEQLRLVAFAGEPLQLDAGSELFKEGETADEGFLLISGRIGFYTKGEEGRIDKGAVGPGALIGELALLAATARPATAEALEPSSLRSIPRRGVRRVLEEYPELAEGMRRALAHRLTTMTGQLERTRQTLLALDSEKG
jgi:CRP-like cAMP-binding protein